MFSDHSFGSNAKNVLKLHICSDVVYRLKQLWFALIIVLRTIYIFKLIYSFVIEYTIFLLNLNYCIVFAYHESDSIPSFQSANHARPQDSSIRGRQEPSPLSGPGARDRITRGACKPGIGRSAGATDPRTCRAGAASRTRSVSGPGLAWHASACRRVGRAPDSDRRSHGPPGSVMTSSESVTAGPLIGSGDVFQRSLRCQWQYAACHGPAHQPGSALRPERTRLNGRTCRPYAS